ncbi:hypothetical protein SeMB42_g03279 [Synchytrium endobioticum]|uniref:Protein Mpv17 n=1 Tax=Synchytrium endobioticum TaxID=286115 RepID=A0A507D7N0_9FUNG|nr:hypothetical protein SeMB42_g03279 [Synchytrium endobioticum]TPX51082.1 hypothetical protein SeLEV6574_g00510 [Synchytrium endobioticum]
MAAFIKIYDTLLTKHPILVQSATTGFFFALGDVIAQHFVEKRKNHDLMRTVRMTVYGTCIGGPAVALWYRFLFSRTSHITSPVQSALLRVAADQIVCAPIFMGAFFIITGLMEQRPWKEIKAKLRFGYRDALVANYQVWPAFQLVNFYFVPPLYRSLAVAGVSTGWNSYMCWKNATSLSKAQASEKLKDSGKVAQSV